MWEGWVFLNQQSTWRGIRTDSWQWVSQVIYTTLKLWLFIDNQITKNNDLCTSRCRNCCSRFFFFQPISQKQGFYCSANPWT
jgi:hypothetical protein